MLNHIVDATNERLAAARSLIRLRDSRESAVADHQDTSWWELYGHKACLLSFLITPLHDESLHWATPIKPSQQPVEAVKMFNYEYDGIELMCVPLDGTMVFPELGKWGMRRRR